MMRHNPVAATVTDRTKRAPLLPRQRLFALLDEWRSLPMLWIGGPPGAGKTALVASYLEARQLPSVWHHLDEEDNDPEMFLQHLAALVGGSAVRTGSNRRVLRELYRRLPQPGVLVLDDCHEVAPDASLHALLADAAGEIPAGLNLILIGRGEHPCLYSRLLASRSLGILDSRDLEFTAEETRAIAGRVSADERVSQVLHSQCGGWAAGIAITLERLRRNAPDSQSVEHELREAVFGYYAGEIFDRATPLVRRILVATALLPRFSGPQAETLSGSAHASQILDKLASRQLFTKRYAGSALTYEFAPLFREFLLTRINETLAPGEVKALVDSASNHLADWHELDVLVSFIAQSHNWESLVRLVCRHGSLLLAQGGEAVLRNWLDRVPAEISSTDPWLSFWRGAASIGSSPNAARTLLKNAWDGFEAGGDRSGQLLAAAAALESYEFEWSGFEPSLIWIDRLEAHLGAISALPSREAQLRVYASLLFAQARVRSAPQLSALAIARLQVLLECDVEINHRLYAGRSLLAAHCSMLDSNSLLEMTRRLRSLLQAPGCSPVAQVSTLNAIAYGSWFAGAYPDADASLQRAMGTATETRVDVSDPLQYQARHLLAFGRRDRNEMAECVQEMRRVVKSTDSFGLALLSQALAEQALLRGDVTAAASYWDSAVLKADGACARSLQRISRLALAGCRATLGDCAGAAELLSQALALFDSCPPATWRRDYDLLAAYVAMCRGDGAECHRLLAAALDPTQYSGSASQVVSLLPTAIAELCMEAIRAGIEAESARNLIEHHQLPAPKTADQDWPWPFKVYVLGTFRVLTGDVPLRLSRRMQKKTLELLQALIAFGGTDVSAGTLTDALWPDSDGDAGYHALESGLYRLRQLLGAPGAVIMSGGKLSLDRNYFWVDMWAFERELQGSAERGVDAASRLARTTKLYQGHFLEQESDKSWAMETRQVLRDKFLRSIREAARSYESRRLWQEAANIYHTGIALDGMAEDLYRGLMICHRELGDHTEALQVYRRCRDLLTRVLGVQPNPKTQAIYESVRQTLAIALS
jgi:LuxR family transcriptional regulator, maltose regulon positive regulatory protein